MLLGQEWKSSMCVCVCSCSISTYRGIKGRWWGGRCRSDLGAPLGKMIKRPRGARKGGKDARTKPHSSKHSSGTASLPTQEDGVWSLFSISSCFPVFTSKLWNEESMPLPSLPPTPPLSQCPVVGWLLRSRCVWVAVITGAQVPLAHGV